MDTELFVRHPRSIELTEAGRTILPYAGRISDEYDMMKRALSKYSDGRRMLRIAAISFLSYYGMMNYISQFVKDKPDINLNIREINSRLGMELLDTDRVDACMMFSKLVSADRYNKYPLVEDEMMAVMNEEHSLAGERKITLEQLGDQELVLISERDEPFFKDFVIEELLSHSIQPKIRAYGVWITAIQTIVKQSNSVSILPQMVADRMRGSGVIYKEIVGFPRFHFSLVTKNDYSKEVLFDFVRYVKAHMPEI